MQTIFYEGTLSDYEKTIYSMAIAHGSMYSYVLEDEDINALSSLLSVDYCLFRKALRFCAGEYTFPRQKLNWAISFLMHVIFKMQSC